MGRDGGVRLSPVVIALSGGIGSGKSTVAALLAARGATIVEADLLGHQVLLPGGAAHDAVARRWPDVVVDGMIDRRALGEVVFGDAEELAALEALTHPAIAELLAERVAAAEAEVVVVEIPILASWLDAGWPVVVVEAPEAVRRARLLARGLTAPEIDGRMASQPNDAEWRAVATWRVSNEGDRAALEAAVAELWAEIRGRTATDPA